jgi:hypothetical protein
VGLNLIFYACNKSMLVMQFCVFLGQVSLPMDEISECEIVVSHTCGSEQEFYKFYNCYAKEKGFSIR